jgi:2-dehydro-3-deoxyphosphooctonate aldolase (KDO 8-P synthase)
MECHPNPAEAKSDGPNSWPLALVGQLLQQLQAIDATVKAAPRLEDQVSQ